MAKQIITSIKINASAAEVWQILTEFQRYPEWNPFIKSLTGEVQVGNKIKVQLPSATFKPTVLRMDKNKEFKWLGSLLFKGIFDGEHKFLPTENKDGTTTFKQSENFTGILVPLFAKSLDKNTSVGFNEMNQKLKERAESLLNYP